jgi:predicted DNA binding CopG/RHH family protein
LRNAHPNPEQYQSQRILVVEVNQYVYLVPYVEDDDYLSLKTIIPSRKSHTRLPPSRHAMTMQSNLPPSNDSLDQEERELLEAVESGVLGSIATPDLLNQLRESAKITGQKDQRINIRLSGTDLEALRVRALRLGMPYQTLISSVLHRYISGEISDEQLI